MLLVPKYTASLPINFTSFLYPMTKGKGTHTTYTGGYTFTTNEEPSFRKAEDRKSQGEWERAKLISAPPNKFSN